MGLRVNFLSRFQRHVLQYVPARCRLRVNVGYSTPSQCKQSACWFLRNQREMCEFRDEWRRMRVQKSTAFIPAGESRLHTAPICLALATGRERLRLRLLVTSLTLFAARCRGSVRPSTLVSLGTDNGSRGSRRQCDVSRSVILVPKRLPETLPVRVTGRTLTRLSGLPDGVWRVDVVDPGYCIPPLSLPLRIASVRSSSRCGPLRQ